MKKLIIITGLLVVLSGCDADFPGSLLSQDQSPRPTQGNPNQTTPEPVEPAVPATPAIDPATGETAVTTPVTQVPPTTTPTVPTSSANQIYRNDAYNFEFTYPKEFGFVTPNYANLENQVVQLQIGGDNYPKTNLNDAAIAVSTGFAKSTKDCQDLKNQPEGSTGFTQTASINGVNFDSTTGNGAGAGNFYESRVYRTLHGSFCYEITETIHTANIGNFDPGTVTEIDKNAIWNKLETITQTFKFLD